LISFGCFLQNVSSDILGFTGDEATRKNLKLLIKSLSRLLWGRHPIKLEYNSIRLFPMCLAYHNIEGVNSILW